MHCTALSGLTASSVKVSELSEINFLDWERRSLLIANNPLDLDHDGFLFSAFAIYTRYIFNIELLVPENISGSLMTMVTPYRINLNVDYDFLECLCRNVRFSCCSESGKIWQKWNWYSHSSNATELVSAKFTYLILLITNPILYIYSIGMHIAINSL